ncbi:histidine--tRNA ligase, partial [Striga asiatica]
MLSNLKPNLRGLTEIPHQSARVRRACGTCLGMTNAPETMVKMYIPAVMDGVPAILYHQSSLKNGGECCRCNRRVAVESLRDFLDVICFDYKNGFVHRREELSPLAESHNAVVTNLRLCLNVVRSHWADNGKSLQLLNKRAIIGPTSLSL